MDPAAWELLQHGDPNDEVRVMLRLTEGAQPPPNVRVVSHFGSIVTARIRRGDTPEVWGHENVESLKGPRPVSCPVDPDDDSYEHELDEDVYGHSEAADADNLEDFLAAEGGEGVVVGICDWGFDFTHPNFRNDDGTTRLLALWDQRETRSGVGPAPYGYGRVYSRDEINAALRTNDPCAALGYHPASGDPSGTGSHGTHVADIVAGNRREPGSNVGLAHRSDIVFVHLGQSAMGELTNLGDSVELLEGLDFVRMVAGTKPCVLHLSAGKTAGPHQGDTCIERAIDNLLTEAGLLLVQSVGNYADAAMHSHARIGPNQSHTLDWLIPLRDRTPNELEIWYSGQDVFGVTLRAPTGESFTVPLDARLALGDGRQHWGNFYHRRREPNSGMNHVDVYLYPSAPGGRWTITLHGQQVVDGRLHAWIERDARSRYQSRFPRHQATPQYTTNTICNSFYAIAVGAYDATLPDRPATRFSSRGPTADGRQKPEIAAPGYKIKAARSMPRDGWSGQPKLCVKSGTSMAAPWVSGTVALMMAAAGRKLSIHEVRSILIGTADPLGGPKGRSSTRLGYGYLNVRRAVEAARQLRTAQATPAVLAAAGRARARLEPRSVSPQRALVMPGE